MVHLPGGSRPRHHGLHRHAPKMAARAAPAYTPVAPRIAACRRRGKIARTNAWRGAGTLLAPPRPWRVGKDAAGALTHLTHASKENINGQ